MNKLYYLIIVTLLTVSACEKHRFVLNEGQIPPLSEKEKALQSDVRAVIDENLAQAGGSDYKFGQVGDKEELVFSKKDGKDVTVHIKDKTKECKVDLSKKMKIQYKNCKEANDFKGCKIALSATKVCKMRPLFLIKVDFTDEELKSCQNLAYIKNVLALKKELIKNQDEVYYRKVDPNTSTSFIAHLKRSGVLYSIGRPNNSYIIKVDINNNGRGALVCLDNLVQKSAYNENLADKALSKAKLAEIQATNPNAKDVRTNKSNIAVFKVELEILYNPKK